MELEKEKAAAAKRIRRAAARQDLIPSCRTHVHLFANSRERLWWFGDIRNHLQSPEQGLTDKEAERWLKK